MATHFQQLVVKDIRKETADCISVAFDIPPQLQTAFAFTQGQNITLRKVIDGQELRRSYSVCSSPLDNELRIAIKKVADGRFSSWASYSLNKGDTLEVLPPAGKFFTTLHTSQVKHYVAFAAGSGITPLLSIIKTTLATEPQSHFTLIYGNKDRSTIIFREALENLKNKYINRLAVHHILSREKTDAPLNEGRIDAAKCDSIFSHLLDIKNCHEFFICGPEAMILCVKEWLGKQGIPAGNIHFELFTVPGVARQAVTNTGTEDKKVYEGKTSNITIKLDGASFEFNLGYNEEGILDAALKQGADLPYACKGGVCATCRAKLTDGEVHMDTNYALEPEEIKNGYILSCQSHPRSEHVSIDFDVR